MVAADIMRGAAYILHGVAIILWLLHSFQSFHDVESNFALHGPIFKIVKPKA